MMWYEDAQLVDRLPLRYRAYARYSRLVGSRDSRRVVGGSFLLRVLRRISHATGLGSVVPIHGIDGLVVYADFNDERILDVIHEIRGENPEYRVMSQLLKPGDTFIDIGANFGTFSLLASRLVGDNGKVIAIEPQPRLADLISKSLKASEVMNCEIIRAACGSEPGTAELLIPLDDSGRAGMFAGFSGRWRHERVSAGVIMLDDLVDSVSSSSAVMLKIDVEGSEFNVVEGGRRLIESTRPSLLIEMNPWTAGAAGRSPSELLGLLQSLGYQRFVTMESFPHELDLGEIDLERQSNVLSLLST
jgi:FkbM family methyltransferase